MCQHVLLVLDQAAWTQAASRGIRDHRPVSMRNLWDDKRNRENDIL